jgi:glutamate formiminotransferase
VALIECVPNISEGQRIEVVEAVAQAVTSTPGIALLDVSSDPSHNRSVLTFVGKPDDLQRAVVALFEAAVPRIDLRVHRGGHPRMGAVDVVPFVPLDEGSMTECATLARDTAAGVASRFQIPVYLYEEAATAPARRQLEDLRRGQFEGLAARLLTAAWHPDFGPAAPHPTAGATAIGARRALIAYNVNLATDRLDVAREIAAVTRSSGGGVPCVKAMGVSLAHRGIVQVSMNLTDYQRTSIPQAFGAVKREAAQRGVEILDSEIVGLVPAAALEGISVDELELADPDIDRTIEGRLRKTGAPLRPAGEQKG